MISFAELAAAARAAVAEREQRVPLEELREAVRQAPGCIDAVSALCCRGRAVSVIAEVKRSEEHTSELQSR